MTANLNLTDPITQLQTIIQTRTGITTLHQRLTYAGKELNERYTLQHYDIQLGSTLELSLRLVGGVKKARRRRKGAERKLKQLEKETADEDSTSLLCENPFLDSSNESGISTSSEYPFPELSPARKELLAW